MGRAHMNPLLNTRMYQVELAVDKTVNVIAESIYAQFDTDGNEYLLPGALVDYHKDNKLISLTDQQTSIQGRQVTHKTTVGWHI